MYWTFQMATQLDDAPWPASKYELIEYAERNGLSFEIIENLQDIEDDSEEFECMSDIWPEYAEWADRIMEGNDEATY